jgi:hypothetical protein
VNWPPAHFYPGETIGNDRERVGPFEDHARPPENDLRPHFLREAAGSIPEKNGEPDEPFYQFEPRTAQHVRRRRKIK